MKRLAFFLLVMAFPALSFTRDETMNTKAVTPPFIVQDNPWVDSVFNSLTTDQKIAQLFMVAAYSNRDSVHVQSVARLISQYQIGGLIFMQGGPVRQALLTNYYQSLSKVPLMVSIDGEWGLAMRLDSTTSFPKQMALGAVRDDSLIYQMGREVARQCKRIGVTLNFAPVVDVNNNPINPVIGMRSFGEDKLNVTRKGLAYMRGMQDEHLLTTAKHFPGHGDTESDSHLGLPIIKYPRKRLDTLELYPFRQLINGGVTGIMVAHLQVNALDKAKNTPTTLSANVVKKLLRKELGFQGLIFTDALNMKGVSQLYKPGDVEYRALKAGNDVLLFPEDVPVAIARIKEAIASGRLDSAEVFEHCRRILQAKRWVGLDHYKPVEITGIYQDLDTREARLLYRRLVEATVTVAKNDNCLLPLRRLDTLRIATVTIGENKIQNRFQDRLSSYTAVKHFRLGKNPSDSVVNQLLGKLDAFNLVIVSVNGTTMFASQNFGITARMTSIITRVSRRSNVVLSLFASPYGLMSIPDLDRYKAIVVAYEDSDLPQDYAAQAIFGGIGTGATLPVSIPGLLAANQSAGWERPSRVRYSTPDDVGMNPDTLNCIDDIAEYAINMGVTPGCQVLVAKNNTVVFQKSYGYFTYQKFREVNDTDLYDIASITKIVATTPSLMKLIDQNLFSLYDPLCVYLPDLDSSNKAYLKPVDILTHQAGLKSWIPFYLSLIRGFDEQNSGVVSSRRTERFAVNSGVYGQWLHYNYTFDDNTLSHKKDSLYSVEVADNLYLNHFWKDTIYNRIKKSRVSSRKEYVYSDLGYYLFQRVVESRTAMSLDTFASRAFYAPLGANYTGYLPLKRFGKEHIAPTEIDGVFRKQMLQGHVHDPGAAMMGGVCGHAGVFSNANDLVKIMQMYLNKGIYGNERYISDSLFTKFTSCVYCPNNFRGIAFDKPGIKQSMGPVCRCAPLSSYGHTGFTGTICWVDPDSQLIYIFLSNRVHPNAENNMINKLDIRETIQQAIYNSLAPPSAVDK